MIRLLAQANGELLLQADGDTIMLSQSPVVPALDSPANVRVVEADLMRVQCVVEADALSCNIKMRMSQPRWQLLLETDPMTVTQVSHGDDPKVEKLL